MTNLILIINPNDEDIKKINWLKEELEKREISVTTPELPETNSYEEWDREFRKYAEQFTPDTIILTKGHIARFLLKEYEERPLATKGTLLITDNTNDKKEIFTLNYEKIRKKTMKFFIYSFQTNTKFPIEESSDLSDKLEAEFFILEGAKDLSDYEDILIDIISMTEQ
ncbi:hypothetical protein K9L97_05060 [Candidatus Woesearchaeota archaeon]|nr:hypothetical protein [Candidatus Woesearchaeota archaeon]